MAFHDDEFTEKDNDRNVFLRDEEGTLREKDKTNLPKRRHFLRLQIF